MQSLRYWYPVSCSGNVLSVPPNSMEKYLPNVLMKRILSYCSFHELMPVRLVCKRFNVVVQDLLNESLMRTNDKLRRRLSATKRRLKFEGCGQNMIRYYKILHYLRSDLNVVITTVLTYITDKCYNFSGGMILDHYEKLLSVKYDEIESYFAYIKIFHMVEAFLDHFDEQVEPRILSKHKKYVSSWFGVKMINLLDCSLDLNFKIELSTNDDTYMMDGKYQGEELHILNNIPDVKKKLTTDAEKRAFIQSIRNNIRWNNLLYCIEKTTVELSTTCFEPGLHTLSKASSILERRIREDDDDQPGVSYDVTLKCKKLHLPLRANSLIQSNENLLIPKTKMNVVETEQSDKDPSYEFNLVMKIRTQPDDGPLKERTLKIFNVGSSCVVTEHEGTV